MSKQNFFTLHPAPAYFTFPFHVRQSVKSALFTSVISQVQREEISGAFIGSLGKLLGIPENYVAVLFHSEYDFLSLAGDIFLRSRSLHLVHGSRGKEFAGLLKFRKYHPITSTFNPNFSEDKLKVIPANIPAFIFMTEPESGSCLRLEMIHKLMPSRPEFMHFELTMMIPGSLPVFKDMPSFSFGFNTSFGLPFPEVIWFLSKHLFDDLMLTYSGRFPINHLQLLREDFYSFGQPDLLFLDVGNKILEDFNARGIKSIMNETKYKASILEHALSGNPAFVYAVKEPSNRSLSSIVLNYAGKSEDITAALSRRGLSVDFLRIKGNSQWIRITNFPVHSKEQFEMLADLLASQN